MKRSKALALGVILALWASGGTIAGHAAEHRNVVLILADDLGWGDLGVYGHTRFKTPHLDRMAAEGARFTNFYAPMPYCAPSRAALMTGRYPGRCGLTNNPVPAGDVVQHNLDHVGLPLTERTLGTVFQEAGFATACLGKWHLGHRPEFRPTRRGFDEYLGILYSNDMTPVELYDGDRRVEYPVVQATLTRRLTERALAFIDRNRDRPFFLYLPHHMVHKPLAASEDFYKKSGAGLYGDALAELDDGVGRVLAKLKELGLDAKTLVFFAGDNGPWYGGSTGGLRGMKGQNWEGGIREPLIARLPGVIPAGIVRDQPALLMDLFPTALAFAGVPIPNDRKLDGRDLTAVLTEGAASPHEALFSQKQDQIATVRRGKWKLHLIPPSPPKEKTWLPGEPWIDPRGPDGVRILAPFEQAHPSEFPGLRTGPVAKAGLLFDLDADPNEQVDQAAAHPEIVKQLQALAAELRAEFAGPTPKRP